MYDMKNNRGNIAIGNNNQQSIVNNANTVYDAENVLRELTSLVAGKVGFEEVQAIHQDLSELSQELAPEHQDESKLKKIFSKIKNKLKAGSWDVIKDVLADCVKEKLKDPALYTTLLAFFH